MTSSYQWNKVESGGIDYGKWLSYAQAVHHANRLLPKGAPYTIRVWATSGSRGREEKGVHEEVSKGLWEDNQGLAGDGI